MIRRNGTIRSKRSLPALLNGNFQIDDRSFSDILGYIASYLKQINYYNLKNEADGNWRQMLQTDPVIYMVIIINQPLDQLEQKIRKHTLTHLNSQENTQNLIQELLFWHQKIEKWRDNLELLGEKNLGAKINNVLADVLDTQQQMLAAYQSQMDAPKTSSQPRVLAPDPAKSAIDLVDIDLNDIMHTYYRIVLHVKEMTRSYLKNHVLDKDNHTPNNAMYIAFCYLYKRIQNQINALSQEHLDFYYKQILKQKNSPGDPTKTIVCFDLQPTVESSFLEAGVQLSAGKQFGSKEEVLFKTDKPLLLSQINLMELKTLLFSTNPYIKVGTDESLVSSVQKKNLLEKGAEAIPKDQWYTFGTNKSSVQNVQVAADLLADIGLIIGTPVLFLNEGQRKITLEFNLDQQTSSEVFWKLLHQMCSNRKISMNSAIYELFSNSLKIFYTSKTGWVDLDEYSIEFNEGASSFSIDLVLEATDPAVTTSTKTEESLTWPSIKILFNEYAPVYLYSFFRGVDLESIKVSVKVSNIKNLSLYNNLGKISAEGSFEPFGSAPAKGAYLMVGKPELFKKEVEEVGIVIDWENIPRDYGGFDTYYSGYSQTINNASFQVSPSALYNGFWLPTQPNYEEAIPLFKTETCLSPQGYESEQLLEQSTLEFENFNELGVGRDYQAKEPLAYNLQTQSGFIRFTLTSPAAGFGNDLYFKDYTEIATFNAKNKIQFPLPNRPYSPKASGVTLNYKASDTLYIKAKLGNSKGANENIGEYFHISPFGAEVVLADQTVHKQTMICNYEQQGYLIMAFSGVQAYTNVNIYFQFLRSSTTNELASQELLWEYYQNGIWQKFEKGEIIEDGTGGFTKSGIIELLLPKEKVYGQSVPELFWVRVSVASGVENFPIIKGINVNAVEVSCMDTSPEIMGKVIPANSIKKTVSKFPDIKKVFQPAETGNGVLAENGDQFYTRVSERLRHKGRAVSNWDFERLTLENFDAVKVVKCTNLDANFRQVPGRVKVVALSEQWTRDERHYFSNNALSAMKSFLEKRANSLMEIDVINPSVEYLLVNCLVEFKPEDNGGYFLNELNNAISDYLSPIADIDEGIGGIGGKIIPTMITSYIENLNYIDSVKELSVEHIIREGVNDFQLGIYEGSEEILTTTPWSIFSSVKHHNITTIINEEEPADLNIGIGNLQIGLDFIIGEFQEGSLADFTELEEQSNEDLPNDSIFVFKRKT